MKKWRRCPEVFYLDQMFTTSYYCELPDDGHDIHVQNVRQDGVDCKITWCDRRYKDLL